MKDQELVNSFCDKETFDEENSGQISCQIFFQNEEKHSNLYFFKISASTKASIQ